MITTQLDSQALTLIEEHVRRLLDIMGFGQTTVRCRVEAARPSGRRSTEASLAAAGDSLTTTNSSDTPETTTLHIALEAGETGKLLIGAQGNNLAALQHIVRCVLRRQIDRDIYITIDVNGYRTRREQNLSNLAEATARRAKTQGKTVVMRPMVAADRRMIHTTLASRSDVRTESMGDEPNRRVVIHPIFL